jgi:penicillin-binding protein-related factor A (putative recombinase)
MHPFMNSILYFDILTFLFSAKEKKQNGFLADSSDFNYINYDEEDQMVSILICHDINLCSDSFAIICFFVNI